MGLPAERISRSFAVVRRRIVCEARPAAAWRLLACLVLAPLCASADERALIAAERQALGQRFAQEQRDCASRFVVNACSDDVRQRRRDALQPLRERELSLDEAERMRRAAERRRAIAAKQAAAVQPAAVAAPARPQPRLRGPLPAATPNVPQQPLAADHSERADQAAERVREARRRREDVRANQRRVQQRLSERAASGRYSAPLPVPGAGSAAPGGAGASAASAARR